MSDSTYDAIVVGGGPAGLSAGLWLGRCRRRVLVIDAGDPRNAASRGVHGYLSRDGILPLDLRRLGRTELARYGTRVTAGEVVEAQASGSGFRLRLRSARGRTLHCRKLILATGLRDRLPKIEGLIERYGWSVHHCPYCDAFEHADRPLGVYGRGAAGFAVATKLLDWSSEVTLLTDGPSRLSPERKRQLAVLGIALDRRRISRLEGPRRTLARVRFSDGGSIDCQGLFFSLGFTQRSDLAAKLGCRFTASGCVETGRRAETGIPGLFVIGDSSRDTQMAIVAAAEGARAAVRVHEELQAEDRARALKL
jgi:thioredoxin reductase